MKKISFIFAFALITCMVIQVVAFSSQTPAPNTCQSGAYPVSNPVSRGIQRIFGLNLLTTKIAESVVKNQISKQIQHGDVKVNLQAYSAGDLLAGKLKSFEITGKNIAYNGIYLSSVKAQNLCDFTYFDHSSTPATLKSPLFVKYNAEITNNEFDKIFAFDLVKDSLQGIKIKVNNMDFGQVDFVDVKPTIANEKINIKANLVYRRSIFVFKFPINLETAIKIKDDKIFLTNLKFPPDAVSNEMRFITNSMELNNINVFDLNSIEKNGAEINVKKVKVVNDKISIEGTFWLPQNTTL